MLRSFHSLPLTTTARPLSCFFPCFSLAVARLAPLAVTLSALASTNCAAQIGAEGSGSLAAPRLGDALMTRYRVGVRVTAARGGAQKIRAMVAVPLECDEQQVQIFQEDYSPEVQAVDFRVLPGEGAKQMLVQMPRIDSGRVGQALITYEVRTHAILPPIDTSELVVPRRPNRELKRYLGPSRFIEVKHRRIKAALDEAKKSLDEVDAELEAEDEEISTDGRADADSNGGAAIENEPLQSKNEEGSHAAEPLFGDSSSIIASAENETEYAEREAAARREPSADWRLVEAIYDYAIDNVEYKEGVDKSAVQVLAEGEGDCQAIGALFVAMCRTAKVPARLVWVHDHQYAEFYLEDAAGVGHWYPVETAGQRAFGEMPLPRVILQKGDDFRVPERRGERLRYASDYLLGFPMPGGGKPKVKYIREQL